VAFIFKQESEMELDGMPLSQLLQTPLHFFCKGVCMQLFELMLPQLKIKFVALGR
jgi:hypothetical protein